MKRFLVALTSLTFGLGCAASLPDHAKGSATLVEGEAPDVSGLVPYRTLTRADFRSTKAPPEFAQVADRVGAATCGKVMTTPTTGISIHSDRPAGGVAHYRVSIKHLSFQALMDPNCSFWNEKVSAFSPAYVLEHEQIHFALFELGARRLNASAKKIARDVEDEGDSQAEVQRHAENVLREAVRDEMAEIVEQNDDFDEDTSLGYKPARQKAWLERVMSELRATQRWAVR